MGFKVEFICPWGIIKAVHTSPSIKAASFDQNEVSGLIETFHFRIDDSGTSCEIVPQIEGSDQVITPGTTLEIGKPYFIAERYIGDSLPTRSYPTVCRITPFTSSGV